MNIIEIKLMDKVFKTPIEKKVYFDDKRQFDHHMN